MRPHGIDLNHWNGSFKVVANPPRPIDFVIQKTSEAVFRDVAYNSIKAQIQPIPIKGAYHYFRGQWSWKDQMDFFLNLLQGYDFWALDAEKMGNYNGPPILNKPCLGFVENIPLAMEYLVKNTHIPGLFYGGAGMMDWLNPVWNDLVGYDLWVAHYWYKPNPEGIANYFTIPCPRGNKLRKDWKFWQYDANGQGGRGREYGVDSKGLDLNVFNGTVEELQAWAKPKPVNHCPTCGQIIP